MQPYDHHHQNMGVDTAMHNWIARTMPLSEDRLHCPELENDVYVAFDVDHCCACAQPSAHSLATVAD